MRKHCTQSLLLIVVTLLAGCSNPRSDANLTIRDAAGNVVATGHLELPTTLPSPGETFAGKWRLDSSAGSFPADATNSGSYTAYVSEEGFSIDLNPGVADDNVVLHASTSKGVIAGAWSHETFVGAETKGTFSIE